MSYSWINILGLLLCAAAVGYSVIAIVAVRSRIRPVSRLPLDLPPVTLLKPLCGAEPETYECLRSFCLQDYPHYQVIFGVSDTDDPVIEIVRRLQREFPDCGLQLTVNRALHGTSRKVSNLINMMPQVRHEYLVLSDSDVRVPAEPRSARRAGHADAHAVGLELREPPRAMARRLLLDHPGRHRSALRGDLTQRAPAGSLGAPR
jgi:cellulose synthase/poly-beta-1,6-N-acetylglucosamine synthase-like glycosyltransferase